METTNSKTNANETLQESTKMINQWSNEVITAMTELYKKQINLVTGFYGNLFSSLNGENTSTVFNPMKSYTDLFFNNPMKSQLNPFANFSTGNNPFEKTIQQLTDYNQNFINSFTKKFDNGNVDWNTINEKYQQTFEKEFEVSQKMISTAIEAFNKQIEITSETNKNLQKEITEQMTNVFKLNRELWTETLTTSKTQTTTHNPVSNNTHNNNNNSEKNSKEVPNHDAKKAAKVDMHN